MAVSCLACDGLLLSAFFMSMAYVYQAACYCVNVFESQQSCSL